MHMFLKVFFLALFAWVHLAAAADYEPEIWRLRGAERGCLENSCYYHFLIQEGHHTGMDGTLCEIKALRSNSFSNCRCREYKTTGEELNTYRVHAFFTIDEETFKIKVINVERQLSVIFLFSKQQRDDMLQPPNAENVIVGEAPWGQDSEGVTLPLLIVGSIAGRGEREPAAEKRETPAGPGPETVKRDPGDLWHLNEMFRYVEIDPKDGDRENILKFRIQEANDTTPGVLCRLAAPRGSDSGWDGTKCDNGFNYPEVWPYRIHSRYSDDGKIFAIRVKNLNSMLFADFEMDEEGWEGTLTPGKTPSLPGVELPMALMWIEDVATAKRTIGEGPASEMEKRTIVGGLAAETSEKTRGRNVAGGARWAPVPGEASAEPLLVEAPRAERRAGDENYNIEDAPQWTMEDVRRQFYEDQDEGMWRVQFDFVLISTNRDGERNTRHEGVVSCTISRYLPADKIHTKESVWLQRCYDLDFYFSWGYIEEDDSAVVTVLYINPKKDGKSRIAWTSFQDVSRDLDGQQQLGTPVPLKTEEYVCDSDAWPCNQQT